MQPQEELKFVTTMYGEQCVMTPGMLLMHVLFVTSSTSHPHVSEVQNPNHIIVITISQKIKASNNPFVAKKLTISFYKLMKAENSCSRQVS